MLKALINSFLPYEREEQIVTADTSDGIIMQIVEIMWQIINENYNVANVKAKAKELRGANDFETAKNIYDYVVATVPYKSDPDNEELLTDPEHIISGAKRGEDCDGMTMLVNSLLMANGIKSKIKVIAWRKNDFTHVVSEALLQGRWVEIDCTMGGGRGFDVKNRKVIRTKSIENPMELKVTRLNDSLDDCGCKSKKNKQPENVNVNMNPILIGNGFEQILTNYQNSGKEAQPVTRIVEKPVEKVVTKYITKDNVSSNLKVPQIDPKEKFRPTLTLTKGNQNYDYTYFY